MSCCKTYDPCLDGKLNQIGSYASAARQSAQASQASATQSATNAASAAASAAAAAASAEIAGIYLGPFAVAPTTDNEGGPLQEGMLYFDTVSDVLFVWNGAAWASADFNEFTNFTATGTTFARNLVTREADVVNVKDFGAVGDGVTDDTAAIQAAYSAGSHIIFPPGAYAVTNLTWSGGAKIIEFRGGAKLFGISTTPQQSVLTLHNFRQSKIINLEIETDGFASTPVYHPNYECALRLTSSSSGSPTQFVTIDGLFIRYFKVGVISGNPIGQPPQGPFPHSEIFIRDYKVRGVMQQLYQNAERGFITTSGSVYVTQKFEASSSWWDDAQAFNLRADEGDVMSVGDEFQAARTAGFNIYGKGITIIGAVWEHACINYITGNVKITHNTNGVFSNSVLPVFKIAPASVGTLHVEKCIFRNPDGTASFARNLVVDCKNIDNFNIFFDGCLIKEFAHLTNAANAHFVLGGKYIGRNTIIDNSASTQPSWRHDMLNNFFTTFDSAGDSMSATPDLTAKGGWTVVGAPAGASFNKYTASLPSGSAAAIQFTSTGVAATVTTPAGVLGSKIYGDRDYVLTAKLKRLGTVTNFTAIIEWNDFSGALLATSTPFAHDGTRMDDNGFDQWQEFRSPVKAPSGAQFATLKFILGTTCDVALTNIRLY
jgi:hypothetical protein